MGLNFPGGREKSDGGNRSNVPNRVAAAFLIALSIADVSCATRINLSQIQQDIDDQSMSDSVTAFPRVPKSGPEKKEKLGSLGNDRLRKLTVEELERFEVADFYNLSLQQARIISGNPAQFEKLESSRKMAILSVLRTAK